MNATYWMVGPRLGPSTWRFCLRQPPVTEECGFTVLVLFYSDNYRNMHQQPTQKMFEKLTRTLQRKIEWLIHVAKGVPKL